MIFFFLITLSTLKMEHRICLHHRLKALQYSCCRENRTPSCWRWEMGVNGMLLLHVVATGATKRPNNSSSLLIHWPTTLPPTLPPTFNPHLNCCKVGRSPTFQSWISSKNNQCHKNQCLRHCCCKLCHLRELALLSQHVEFQMQKTKTKKLQNSATKENHTTTAQYRPRNQAVTSSALKRVFNVLLVSQFRSIQILRNLYSYLDHVDTSFEVQLRSQ